MTILNTRKFSYYCNTKAFLFLNCSPQIVDEITPTGKFPLESLTSDENGDENSSAAPIPELCEKVASPNLQQNDPLDLTPEAPLDMTTCKQLLIVFLYFFYK